MSSKEEFKRYLKNRIGITSDSLLDAYIKKSGESKLKLLFEDFNKTNTMRNGGITKCLAGYKTVFEKRGAKICSKCVRACGGSKVSVKAEGGVKLPSMNAALYYKQLLTGFTQPQTYNNEEANIQTPPMPQKTMLINGLSWNDAMNKKYKTFNRFSPSIPNQVPNSADDYRRYLEQRKQEAYDNSVDRFSMDKDWEDF